MCRLDQLLRRLGAVQVGQADLERDGETEAAAVRRADADLGVDGRVGDVAFACRPTDCSARWKQAA